MLYSTQTFFLVCDGCGNRLVFEKTGFSSNKIIKLAKETGWKRVVRNNIDYKDYCPKCVKKYCDGISTRLEKLSSAYRQMGKGNIKPHTDEAKLISLQAHQIIRDLVTEWM